MVETEESRSQSQEEEGGLGVHIKTLIAESCWTDCLASVTSCMDWIGREGCNIVCF